VKYLVRMVLALSLITGAAYAVQRDNRNQPMVDSDAHPSYASSIARLGFNDRERDTKRWSRGDWLPERYRQSQYVLGDWQQRHLRIPPSGYRWLRSDNDQYLLERTSSRVVADIVNQDAHPNDLQFARGEVMPTEYRSLRYAVVDWRANDLSRPDPGCRWVFINYQFFLVSTSTGLITDVVFNRQTTP